MNIGKSDPILTVCEAGLDRSVALKAELVIKRGYKDVLNCGIDTISKDTFDLLQRWAKLIIVVADDSVWKKIPWEARGHAVFANIGKDVWRDPRNPELEKVVREVADKLDL